MIIAVDDYTQIKSTMTIDTIVKTVFQGSCAGTNERFNLMLSKLNESYLEVSDINFSSGYVKSYFSTKGLCYGLYCCYDISGDGCIVGGTDYHLKSDYKMRFKILKKESRVTISIKCVGDYCEGYWDSFVYPVEIIGKYKMFSIS